MINTQLKLLFIDIPKTGTSAFKTFLFRGFHEFTWQPATNGSWKNILCPKERQYLLTSTHKTEIPASVRHEPLLSTYTHVLNLNSYFIFSIVRDPFERFKSAFLEAMMFTRYKVIQKSTGNPNTYSNLSLQDPWFIYPHHSINNYFVHKPKQDSISLEEIQVKLIFNQLKIIANKGGFDKIGVCDVPLHFWPQYLFTSLTLPNPLNITYIKYENLEKDFPILKEELTYVTGVDIRNEELPFVDPMCTWIFSHHNPEAIDTIGYKFDSEKEISRDSSPDLGFINRYPDFKTFADEFKKEKQMVMNYWLPTLEEHRDLIEHLYAEDYRLFGYDRKS